MIITIVKKLIIGSPLEEPARSIIDLFNYVIDLFRNKHKSEWAIRVGRDDKNMERLLRKVLKKDSNCVDIGANRGLFLKQFIRLSPKGKHYAFEPLPELAATLRKEFPDVEVHNCALSNSTSKATLYHEPEID